jgi:hypothetical protein
MRKKRQIIGKLVRISLFLLAMFLLVVRSFIYSFYPVDYKHIFLTAAILGVLFLFFHAQANLKKAAKLSLVILFFLTVSLMVYIPTLKINFHYKLALHDDWQEITINSDGLDRRNIIRFSSHLSPDMLDDFQILDRNSKKVEYTFEENNDPLRLINYYLDVKNSQMDIQIKYRIKHRVLYLNDIFIFPESDIFDVGYFKVSDESNKSDIFTELPLEKHSYNLSFGDLRDLRYSMILIDNFLQIIKVDEIGNWRFICKKEYVRENIIDFLKSTQIHMRDLYGYSFPLDIIVGNFLPTGKHKKKGLREIIVFQPKDLNKSETVIHELFHCYHTNLWYNTIQEGITEFLTYYYSMRFSIITHEDFENRILEYYSEYFNFPYVFEKSISEIDKIGIRWIDNNLPYSKGFLISLMINNKMMEKNKDFFNFLIDLSQEKKYINNEKFITFLNRYSGQSFNYILDDYINGTKKIEPEDCIDISNFKIIRKLTCITFLGIKARFNFIGSLNVTEIQDNSPFINTDLRVGDEIIKWSGKIENSVESMSGSYVIIEDIKKYGNFFWTGEFNKDDLVSLLIKRDNGVREIVAKPTCIPGISISLEKL